MKTVLIIENNLHIRENTTGLLELEGFKVINAVNGVEGRLLHINPLEILFYLYYDATDGRVFGRERS